MKTRGLFFACVGCLVSLAPSGAAETLSERDLMRVTYQAAQGCPKQADFEARVSSRVTTPWLARDGDFARPLRVVVTANAGTWMANLDYQVDDGHILTRSVSAATCSASVEAIALAAALLIESPPDVSSADPHPTLGGATEAAALSQQQGPQSRTPRAEIRNLGTPPNLRQSAGLIASASSTKAPRVQSPTDDKPSTRAREFEVGAGPGLAFGLGPKIAGGVFVWGGSSLGASLVRVGATVHESALASTDVPGFRMRVQLIAVRLEVCPLTFPLTDNVSFLGCAGAESGRLASYGSADPHIEIQAKQSSDFWLMVGLAPRLRAQGKWLFAEVGPDASLPLSQRTFAVSDGKSGQIVAYHTPLLVFGVLSSIGLRFQ